MNYIEAVEQLNKIRTDEEVRKEAFTVAFCGVFSSGKSSVLNYFLNYKDFSLPVGDFPITKLVTRIKYGNRLKFYYKINNGTKYRYISKEEFEQFVVGKGIYPKGCNEINIEIPVEILKSGVVFLDTPGFLDEMGGNLEKISREAVLKCDLAIFCTSAAQLGNRFEKEYIEELEQSIGNYCMLVNHMDCCNTDEDEEDIHKVADSLMKGKGGPILNNLFGRNYFFQLLQVLINH